MALTRLDNLISSKTGKYLYVSPDDFNASDELNNRGNSPIRPFKSIQRAFIETARYSYLPGPDNDRFDQFTIMLMPGKHYIDNRPGLASAEGITPFTFNQALTEWEDSSNLDIGDPNNKIYLFNNTEGGAIIPRGSSLVGYDLRRTAVHPLYVPDPADMLEKRSAIFNVTGGCYFWQFTIRDGDLEPSSPLYDVNEGVGKVYSQNGQWDAKEVPNFSHHKLTVFEYADKEELGLYYQKVAKAFSQYQPTIDDPGEFGDRVQETRIVGPLSDFRSVESITCTDSSPAGTITVDVVSKVNHGYFKNQFVAIENNGLDEQIDGTFSISSIDLVDQRKFSYQIPGTVAALGTITNLVSGTTYTSQNGLSANAVVKAEVDTVESASPYVFNCSIRSTWGICGIWANGLKATGFKSMVIAQYTGVSLQKDDRAFIRYDEYSNTFNQAPLTDAFATVPYHTKGDAFWKDDWRNFHVRASEDAFIQCVSIFAVGYADHFLMESGGDMSITNSNSNFGNTSLHAKGHKGYAFAQDKGGYVTDIIPPQIVQDTTGNTKKNAYYTLDVKASNDQTNHTKIFIGDDSGVDPGKRPAATIDGYRIGARSDEKIFVKLTPRTAGGDNIFSSTLSPTGFKKFTSTADVLNPSGVTVNNADLDAANLIEANKTFIAHEAYGYITGKYPTLLIKEGITIDKCRRDIGYLIDATVQDLRLGGNINTIQAAESYYVANQLSYITGELTETLEGYNYAKDLALASTRNFTYLRTGASSVSGSSLVNVGDTSGIVQGMTVADYDPSMFTNGKLNTGATRPGSPAIPDNTFVKKIVDSATIEIGQKATFSEKKVVADRFGDARNLILSNKTFIATEAYERMLLDFPNYTPSSGYDATTGKAKCIDDLEKAITAIAENVGYGGNAETWDAAYYYESGAVLDLANKKDETVRGFTYARDMAIQVMRNDDVFVFGTHGLTQTKDTSITYGTPDAVNDRAGDARGLILANKNLIAHEAVERMVLTSSTATYTPTGATYDAVSGDLVLTIPNHGLTGSTPHSATGASYVPSTGALTITLPSHGFSNGERVQIQDNSLTFTCAMDNNTTTHTYPRVTDPVSGKWLIISNVTTNTFDVHVGESPIVSFTPTTADYNPTTGLMTLTIGNHGLSVGTNVQITQNSLTFTCAQDSHATQHTYPRASDPASKSIAITAVTATTITVQVLASQPSTNTTAHTFVSAAASSVKTGGDYAHTFSTAAGNGVQRESDAVRFDFNALTFTCAMDGNGSNHSYPRISDPAGNSLLPVGATTVNTITLNVGKSPIKSYDVTDATYDQNTGDLSLSIDNHNLVKGTSIKLANNSLTFTCDKDNNATTHSYPRSTDPAYNTAVTITDIGSSFKTPTGASYDPATGIMQVTSPNHGFTNGDRVKISENSLTFTCAFDGNATEHSYPRESDPYFGKWLEVSNVTSSQFTVNVGAAGANQEYTPSTASYDPSSGDLVLTIGTHQLSVGDGVTIDNDALSFTCTMDGNQVPQAYPRAGKDRASGRSLDIKASTADSITVNVENAGDDKNFQPSAATYNQATGDLTLTVGQHGLAVGADVVLKNNSLTFTCDKDSNATQHSYPRPGTDPWAGKSISVASVGSTDHSITGASYTPTTGALLLSIANHGFSNGDYVKIADGALTLSCALGGAGSHTYVGGTVANAINGGLDITAATYDPTTGVMTVTSAGHSLTTSDTALVSANSLSFTCDKDGHNTIHTYPRTTDPAYNTPIAITAVTNDTISFNVGIATTGKAYPRAGYDYPSGRWLKISNAAQNAFQVNVGISQDTSAHYFVSSIANGLAHQDGTFTINVGAGAVADQYPHIFVSADADAVQYKPQSVHTFVSAAVDCVKHLPQSVHTFKRGSSNGIEKQGGSITINVDVGTVGNRFGHTFVSATAGAVVTGGNYGHTWVSSEADSVHKVFSVGNSRAYHNQDCVDDVVDLLEAVADNVAYGGNDKTWDAAYSYKTGAHVAGEETETNVVFEHTKELAVQAARNQKILPIGSHGISQVIDTTITTDIADPPTDRFGDARNLIISNKNLIAQEAYSRMLLQYPTYLPPTGDPQDCLDDLLDFVEEVSYNTAFGGNDRTWDMANLYVSLAICAGQTDQVVMAFRDATEIMIQVMRQEKVLIIGKHGLTQAYDTALTVATQTPQDNKVGDAKNLIDANKNFVAEIALGRMIAQYPNYTWQTGYTSTDCLDDLKDVVDVVGHNLAYGGNDRVWDAANMYVAGAHASGSENETIAAFNHVRDLIIQVMTNETVTVGGHTALTQAKDTTITADTNTPKCPNQRATVTSLVQVLTDTISTPTSLHSVTRTQSVTKCEDVRSAVNTLSNIVTNALQTPESLTGITRSVSGATYDPATGDLTLTIGAHSIAAGTYVQLADNSLTFTCGMDSNASNHTYPRTTDPISGQSIAISGVTADSITVNVGDASPSVNYTPTNATYNASSGYMMLTIGAHSLAAGSSVRLADDGFTFTCTKDGNATNHTYPRATDPAYQTAVNIVSVTSTTITVDVGASGLADQYVHTFVSAAADSLITGGNYPHTFVSASANAITTGGVIRTRSVGKCENVRTSIDTLINIVKNTVSSPTSLDSVLRTPFTTGSCQNVASSVTTLFKLITDAITSTTSDSLDAVERVPSPLGVAFGPSVNANSSTSNSYLYFVLTAGVYTTDYTPTIDDSITQDTGYPQCNTQSDTIRQYFANINTIIQTGLNTVPRTQPATATSALSSRSTLWKINGTNPHNLETGTPVRLVPRPRYDTTTNKYVEVDKRHVRLPNGFDTNTKYYVIASGRNTKPENYSTATQFNGGAASQLYMMLASSKENAAAGIYIHSAEVEAIHPDVEIDIYQFVLDDKYDLHQYSCVLDGSVTAGIKTDVPHIFDIVSSNTTEHEVFFRANEGGSLPVLGSAYATNPDFADTTTGEIRGNKFFFARYQNEKVFTIHATKNDAIANVNPITFQPGTYDFSVFADKRESSMKYDPSYPNPNTTPTVYGKWYLQVENNSQGAGANSMEILSRFHDATYSDASGQDKTNDSWYERIKDDRDADERIYRLRYIIPQYLQSVRDPLNGFTIKVRKDETRKLLPQKLVLKPVSGSVTKATFYNPVQANEKIGYTDNDFVTNSLNSDVAYDPYKKDLVGNTQFVKKIETTNYISMSIQSGRYFTDTQSGDELLELTVFDQDVTIPALLNETFITVAITNPQGGSFIADRSQSVAANRIEWDGNSTGYAYIHAALPTNPNDLNSQWHLILKRAVGPIDFSATDNIRFSQGTVFADLTADPDYGKSLVIKDLIKKGYPEYYYRQNGAALYTITPGDIITDDANIQFYVDSVTDVGDLNDTFYVFDTTQIQKRIFGQQDGIYYLTAVRGNNSPLPTGAGNLGNFRDFKFSQPISKLYPLNYKNDPLWYQQLDATLVDPPQTYSAADNYVHGLVRVNDFKGSMTKEAMEDFVTTLAFENVSFTGTNDKSILVAQKGNASSGSEDRLIPITGHQAAGTYPITSRKRMYVELRRPSIARAGNHTFEYLGFGPGNYSTGMPVRQEVVLTSTQDFYAQSKKQNGGLVFYTGLNSNGDLYIGNRKINAITGEEVFLERAALVDSEDAEEDIGDLVTTFDTPVTFNQNITVNGGDAQDKDSFFNSPVRINVLGRVRKNSLTIGSYVSSDASDKDDQTLDRGSQTLNTDTFGDVVIGRNRVAASIFQFNPRGSAGAAQGYKIQNHVVGSLGSNITPNQSPLYNTGLGTALDSTQQVNYGNAGAPLSGDMLLKGNDIGQSGSLGWIYANYFAPVSNNSILHFTMNGSKQIVITWGNSLTNQQIGVTSGSQIKIGGYSDSAFNGTWLIDPNGFSGSATTCTFNILVNRSSIGADNPRLWASEVTTNPDISFEFSNSTWMEFGVLGAETLRTRTQNIGDYKLGVNTVARANHSAYLNGWTDIDTVPRANLDVVGTTFISGRTITNFLDESQYPSRTKVDQDHALLVGGDSAVPDNTATLRVATSGDGKVGINTVGPGVAIPSTIDVTNEVLDSTLTVVGTGRFTDNVKFEQDVLIGSWPDADLNGTVNVTTGITTGTFNFLMDNTFVGTQSNTIGGSKGLLVAGYSQNIEIGNAQTAEQDIKIGNTSTSSEITIGATPSGSGTDISQITIGGADASNESSSYTRVSSRALKIDGDAWLGFARGITDSVNLASPAGTVEFFSNSGGPSKINFALNASEINVAGQGGTTTINNQLEVIASAKFNADVHLCGGLESFTFTGIRGQLGSTIYAHDDGVLANEQFNKNVDILNVLVKGQTDADYNEVNTEGTDPWGGTEYQNARTNVTPNLPALSGDEYYLPIRDATNGYFAENDYLLIDSGIVGTTRHPEIVQIVELTSVVNSPYYLKVKRQPFGTFTGIITDHQDLTAIYKVNVQFDSTWTEAALDGNGPEDTVDLAEFGGGLTINDYIFIDREPATPSTGEAIKVGTLLGELEQKLKVSSCGSPDVDVFVVNSVSGNTYIGGTLDINNSVAVSGGCEVLPAGTTLQRTFQGDLVPASAAEPLNYIISGISASDIAILRIGDIVKLNGYAEGNPVVINDDTKILEIHSDRIKISKAISSGQTINDINFRAVENETFVINNGANQNSFYLDTCSAVLEIGNQSRRIDVTRALPTVQTAADTEAAFDGIEQHIRVYSYWVDPLTFNNGGPVSTLAANAVTDSNHPGDIFLPLTQLGENDGKFAIGDLVLVGKTVDLDNNLLQGTDAEVMFVESVDETTNTLRCTPAQEGTTAKPLTTYVATTTTVKRLKKHVDTSPVESIEARNRQLSGVATPYVSLVISEGYIVPTKLDYPTWVRFVDTRDAAAGGTFADQWFYVNGNLFGSVHKAVMNEYLHDGIVGHSTGSLKVNKDFEMVGGNIDIYDSVRQTKILSLKNDDGHADHAGTITFEAGVTGRGALTIYPVTCPEQQSGISCDPSFSVDSARNVVAGSTFTVNGEALVNPGKNPKFTVDNLGVNGTDQFVVNHDSSIDAFGISNFYTKTGGRHARYLATGAAASNTYLEANVSYFLNIADGDEFVVYLPENPITGDTVNIVEVGGNLTYNTSLIVRAQGTGTKVQGDSSGTALGGLATAYTAGELVVQTPNAAFTLIYLGGVDSNGSPVGGSYSGWWLKEV